ncbi:MAG: hypothetical protein ACOYEV_00090 [Candidatus Nanopelagicales bacterium]
MSGRGGTLAPESAKADDASPGALARTGGRVVGWATPRWWWALVFGLFAAAAVPITVSFDGLFYFQGSKGIFSPEAFDTYQWVREPLFPLILRVVRGLGGTAAVWIVAVQAVAAATAAWIVATAVLGRGVAKWVALVLILFNPLTLGYTGAILQQTWISLALALQVLVIAMASRRPLSRLLVALLWLASLLFSVYLLAPLGYVAAVSAGAAVWLSTRPVGDPAAGDLATPNTASAPSPATRAWIPRVGRVLLAGLAVLVTLVAVRAALLPWQSYKHSVIQGSTENTQGLPATLTFPSPLTLLRDLPGNLPTVADTASVLLDIPLPGASSTWGGDENAFFGWGPFTEVRRCGVVQFSEEPVAAAASQATAALISPSCVSQKLQSALGTLVQPGAHLHRFSSYAFVLGLLLVVSRRGRRALLMLTPFYAYWAMYAIYGASLDRYGFVLYQAGIVVGVFAAAELVRLVARAVRGRPSRPVPVGSAVEASGPANAEADSPDVANAAGEPVPTDSPALR